MLMSHNHLILIINHTDYPLYIILYRIMQPLGLNGKVLRFREVALSLLKDWRFSGLLQLFEKIRTNCIMAHLKILKTVEGLR